MASGERTVNERRHGRRGLQSRRLAAGGSKGGAASPRQSSIFNIEYAGSWHLQVMSQLFPCAVAVVHELVIADLVSRSRSSSTARFSNGGGGVRHEVEADDTRWLRLVEQDVFKGRPQGRYSGGA